MTSHHEHRRGTSAGKTSRFVEGVETVPADVLMSVIAGAYTRGLADAVELLGLPAIFLGRDGGVLFSNAVASSILGDELRIEAGHLVASTPAGNEALSCVIAGALAHGASGHRGSARIDPRLGAGLTFHTIAISDQGLGSAQLLCAILLIDDGGDPVMAGFLSRLGKALRRA